MTTKETIALLKALKSAGVTRYKSADLELEMASSTTVVQRPVKALVASSNLASPAISKEKPVNLDSEGREIIPHEIEELTSLLKLDNIDLVDRLFPVEVGVEHEEMLQ